MNMKENRIERNATFRSRALRWLLLALCLLIIVGSVTLAYGDMVCNGQYESHAPVEHARVEATCSAPGIIAYWQCSQCQKCFSDATCTNEITDLSIPVNPAAHNLAVHENRVEPTCSANGHIEYWQCSICSKYFSDGEATQEISQDQTVIAINPSAHSLTHVDAVSASCTAPGHIEYWQCTLCNKYFKADGTTEISESALQTTVPHDLIKSEAVGKTCTTPGNSEYWTCRNCHKYFGDENATSEIAENSWVIPASHTLTHVEASAGDCQTEGNIEYWHCSVCGQNFVDANGEQGVEQTSTGLGNHAAVKTEAKAATCGEAGNIEYWQCSVCKKYFSDESCAQDKEITQESTVVAALDHDWDMENAVVTQQFPCVEGTKTFTCKRDNTHTKTEPVAPTAEHTWVAGEVTKAATTTEEGAQTYTCSVCGTSESRVLPVIATYAVTFYNEDGVTPLAEAKQYEANTPVESIEIPAAPEKASFLFVKWVSIADGVSDIAPVTADAGYKPVYESLTRTSADGLYTYVLNPEKTEATIIAWNGANDGITPISVPQQLDGVNVVAIGDGVFQGRFTDPNLPAIVVVPAGVRTIGNNAFAENPMLAALYLPDTLEAVGENIILNDTGLSFLVLTCTQATTLNPANVFIHNVNRDGTETPVSVTLPMNVTDIIVTVNTLNNQAGNLTIACPFTVQAGHGVSVEGGTILNNNAALTNYGSVSVYGTFNNNSALYNLGALANAGAFNNASNVFSCYAGATVSGGISGNAVVTAHSYGVDGKCTVCGFEDPDTNLVLKIKYTGAEMMKVYDKTANVKDSAGKYVLVTEPKLSDFRIESGILEAYPSVSLSGFTVSKFSGSTVGSYKLKVTFTLNGDDASRYQVEDLTVNARITPKEIIITPFENEKKLNPSQDKSLRQKKVYGASDPSTYHGTASGLLKGDSLTGKLSREPGENVGQYRILPGTMSAGDNYTINVLEGYFVIEPKSINASDMGLAIGNQRYTGEAVKPDITLRYGKTTLVEGTDFKAEFSDNVQPGTAKVVLTGIGNYTGTRETTFRILNIASATSGSGSGGGGGSSGGSSYSYSGFDDGEGDDEEEGEDEEETESEGTLILGGNDYGTILFDHAGRPYSFVQYEEELPLPDDAAPNAIPDMQLTIVADPLYDEETGETIMLGDTEREKYDTLHLRLTTSLVQTLTGMGYTELVYELENADLHIPLAALLAEIPLEETPEAEVISVIEGEIDENGESGEDVEELEMDLAPQVLKVDAYDICIEQVEVAELTERETGILQSYEPKVPGYRVRVRAVIDGEEGETSLDMPVATTEEGETLVELPPADKLPEGTYPIGLVLRVLPMDEVYTEQVAGEDPEIDSIIIEHPDEEEEETYQLQGVDAVFISDIETPEDKDIVDVAPAVFHDIDGMLYAGYSVNADGIYCAGTALPEGMVSTFISSEPEGDSEEEFVDMFSTPANTLSGIGTTFTLDENGNPVVEN